VTYISLVGGKKKHRHYASSHFNWVLSGKFIIVCVIVRLKDSLDYVWSHIGSIKCEWSNR
jgi:hypothetical protein